MNKIDKFQLFINRHYQGLKLVLLIVILILTSLIAVQLYTNIRYEAERQAKSQAQRTEAMKTAIETIQRQSDEQTDDIKAQFQALCVLIINNLGTSGLEQLNPPIEERCREALSDQGQPAVKPSEPARRSQHSSKATTGPKLGDSHKSKPKAGSSSPTQEPVEQPRTGLLAPVLNLLDGLKL